MGILLLSLGAIVLGIAGLVWGADRFVASSASFASTMGISPLVVGLTIVSVGTSAPEIVVSINAALSGSGELAIGNALGSNLANMGLVLAITLLIAPVPVHRHLIRQECPALLLITAVAGLCLYNADLSRLEGMILILLVVPLLAVVIKYKKGHAKDTQVENITTFSNRQAGFLFITGLVVLLVSADIAVWGASSVASYLGISELVIGLTVIAIGTSLPELAASVMSALKGHHDIAIGNIIGSNLFNILLVMGLAGSIQAISLDYTVFSRDYVAMTVLTLVMVALIAWALRGSSGKGTLSRTAGFTLLILYCSYNYVLWLSSASGSF
jgi:cation:H+ antiporter